MLASIVGLSHQTAPLEIRETVAVSPAETANVLGLLGSSVAEAVILSTCNRTELYTVHREPAEAAAVFQSAFPESGQLCQPYLYTYQGEAVARHLFRVASGLDSLVFGEAEILGQVRHAWELAHDAGAAGAITSRLFQQALSVGKRVRSETDIGKLSASFSSAAVVLAQRVFGQDLTGCSVLVIGVGEVGQGVARCLLDRGVTRISIANHRGERALEFAGGHGAAVVSWPVSPAVLAQSDIVISSTAAPETVLDLQDVDAALTQRTRGPMHLIDLAIPRDIDPRAALLPSVHLHNIDDIASVVTDANQRRQESQPQVEAVVEDELESFERWLRQREVSSSIEMLRTRAESVRVTELEWALLKLSGLSEKEREVVAQLTSRLVNKLLHTPMVKLREAAALGQKEEYETLVQDMFGLGAVHSAAAPGRNPPDKGKDASERDWERGMSAQ